MRSRGLYDAASRIVVGHESFLHVLRKRLAPKVGASLAVANDSSHPRFGGVRRPHGMWSVGCQFGEVGGARAEVGGQAGEGADVVPEMPSNSHSVVIALIESKLHRAEETGGTWCRQGNEAELSEDALPCFPTHAAASLEIAEQLCESRLPVRG